MTPQTVIDLSLSTDDEGTLPNISKKAAIFTCKAKANSDFAYLSDVVDSVEDIDHLAERPSKRRKSSDTNAKGTQCAALPPKSSLHPPPSPKRAPLTNKTSATMDAFALSDDIVFSSSANAAPVVAAPSNRLHGQNKVEESDDSLPENPLSTRQQHAPSFSGRTAALLANLKKPPAAKKSSAKGLFTPKVSSGSLSRSPKARRHGNLDVTSSEEDDRRRPKTTKKLKRTDEEKALGLQEREEARVERVARKEKEKEEEKQRKQILREEKIREKQRAADLTEVNKAKKDKKETAKEMMVDLPVSIEGQRVDDQIKEFLRNLDIECKSYQSPVSHVIRWRRKVESYFDEEKGYRISMPREIRAEKHVLCLVAAKDFISLVTADSTDPNRGTLEEHIRKIRTKFEGCIPIYLIEGFNAWTRKNRNHRNREYQAAVLSKERNDDPSQQAATRRKTVPETYIDEDLIEDAMLKLQVLNNCLVHHTSTPFESAEWVANFTQHISLIPYRQEKMQMDTTFCMESGQVKTGEDVSDTFVKMLQEVSRVTAPIAHGIANDYTNVVDLVRAFHDQGPLVLEDVMKATNKNGSLADRRIGPAVSKRLHSIFTESDPLSTEV